VSDSHASPSPRRIDTARAARDQAGHAILAGVDKAISTRWGAAKDRADRLTGNSPEEKVQQLTVMFARELGAAGAVAGGAAAAPVVGTGLTLATSLTEFGYFTTRAGEMVLTVGAIHGHHDATIEEQRAWILCVLAFGNGASKGFTRLAGEAGKGLGRKAVQRVPRSVLQSINTAAGRTLVTKYGTRRGVVALGRAVPFGIGALIGGTANYTGIRLLGRHANKFFNDLPYETHGDTYPDPGATPELLLNDHSTDPDTPLGP